VFRADLDMLCKREILPSTKNLLSVRMPQSGNPRNIHVYTRTQQGSDPVLVAGLLQLGRSTVSELYACLEICFEQPAAGDFRLIDSNGVILSRTTPNVVVPIMDYSVISLSSLIPAICLTSSGSVRLY